MSYYTTILEIDKTKLCEIIILVSTFDNRDKH